MINNAQSEDDEIFYFPLSFAQQRLWLFQQMQPESTAYNITGALRLTGDLDIASLETALANIIQRHEVLRTTFAPYQGEPSQWVHPGINCTLEHLAAPKASLDTQLQYCRELAEQLSGHVFNLQTGPLIKLQLVQLSAQDYVLLSVVHHIISDGWSMGVFVKELTALYQSAQHGQPGELAELEIQYGDFAIWQREWFEGDTKQAQIDYWRQQLDGIPPLLNLPTDYPRPTEQSFNGATLLKCCDDKTTAALKLLANQQGATLNMVLLAVYFVLLHRYSGEHDLVVGTPVANRNQHELEALIGFFANTLVIRAELDAQTGFTELLQQIKRVSLAALEHQDCPFEQLIDSLRPERSLSYSPLIQTLFSFQNAPEQELRLAEVRISQLQLERNNAQFDLALMAVDTGENISLEFSWCSDLFKRETVENMADHYLTLCRQIAVRPESALGAIPLMDTQQYQTMISSWNKRRQTEQVESNIMATISKQVLHTPDAIAIECNQRSLTYRQLASQSDQLAQQLIKRGLKPGQLVGLCVERGVDLILAMFAIIKAGAAYVPMDPVYPAERLKLMVSAAELSQLVIQQHLTPTVRDLSGNNELTVHYLEDLASAPPLPVDLPELSGEQLIYMIFTSGSTGIPKGAGVQHKSFANLVLNWFIPEYKLQEAHSTLLCTSVSFDLTQKNFFAPLVFGGTLHLYPQQEYDPALLVQLIEQYQIGWINTTPSAFYPLTDVVADQTEGLASLRYVFLGGEPIVLGRMQPWLDYAGQRTLIANTYGPTECTDVCMYFNITQVDDYLTRHVPLGRAIDNVDLYVLDDGLNPLPSGVPGELCIGGFGVGVGYLNDKQKTAEKFLPDPFSATPGARLYKTGDRVRFSHDQGFVFIGRSDHQVKVRGFRIDLGEIEMTLNAHPLVKETIVITADGETGDKVLIAYFVSHNAELDNLAIRDYLAERLPHYMLPQFWMQLDQLPLTPSGKVNRLALPKVISADKISGVDLTQPDNQLEQAVLDIWREVLECTEIGTEQSFFDLGGHSLNATQIASRVKQTFAVDMPMRVIFESPTIKQQADWISQAQQAALDAINQDELLNELADLSDDELDALL